ncbi:uncharacterized protein LOC116286836 [Actinia tenebrosa]|uniref:Uncharacterized protein LOC116286836 n=1 Tax=Actinia tenebrosa TaxID=6105 RepID=A0A6P8H950_ACTTE|nr:uncharacterized protein LOC116286836 [Actinia tenebrosa]
MLYEDDTQICLTSGNEHGVTVDKIENCIKHIIGWCSNNFLLCNTDKTKVIHFSSKFSSAEPIHVVNIGADAVQLKPEVCNLGIMLDKHLVMTKQINDESKQVVCSSHFSEKDIDKTLTGIKKLKRDAEPSLGHQWSKPKDTNKRALPKSRKVETLDKRNEDIVTSCDIEEDVAVPVENIDNMEGYQENSQDDLIKELRMQVDGLQKQVQSLNDECQYHKSKYFLSITPLISF